MLPSKQQTRERDQHILVVVISLALFLTPALLLLISLKPLKEGTVPDFGIVRDQPGQATLVQADLAGAVENKTLAAIERLNAGLTRIVLHEPLQENLLGSKNGAEIRKQLLQLNPAERTQMEIDLDIAGRCGATWEPSIKPWGLYMLPTDLAPTNGKIPYGIIQIPYGTEKTLMDAERTINQLNLNFKKTQLLAILQEALLARKINDATALQLIAVSELLQIKYRPEKNLFLSDKTLQEWSSIEATLKP